MICMGTCHPGATRGHNRRRVSATGRQPWRKGPSPPWKLGHIDMESRRVSQYKHGHRARLRTQAEQMISPEAKSLMLGAADDYEHLTQITEAMALIRGVLASAIEDDESRTR
jgi:hypothetical protein